MDLTDTNTTGGVRIYVASSWRNPQQPEIVRLLRANGHDVYDFREPAPGNHGFSWHEIDPTIPRGPADLTLAAGQIRDMLNHPVAEDGFALDMGALRWCEACVLLLPCGRSAHLEAGWAAGAGRCTIGLLAEGEPDLMWKMLDALVTTPDELVERLSRLSKVEANVRRDDGKVVKPPGFVPPDMAEAIQ